MIPASVWDFQMYGGHVVKNDTVPLPVTVTFVVNTNLAIKKWQMNCREQTAHQSWVNL